LLAAETLGCVDFESVAPFCPYVAATEPNSDRLLAGSK